MRISVALAVAIATLLVPSVALADVSYTFQVPIAVSNLPSGAAVQAACAVYSGTNGSGSQLKYATSSASAVTGGSFSGTLSVSLTSPAKPASYQCYMMVYNGGKIVNLVNGNATSPADGWTGTMVTTANL